MTFLDLWQRPYLRMCWLPRLPNFNLSQRTTKPAFQEMKLKKGQDGTFARS
jgi:hypothetical protein